MANKKETGKKIDEHVFDFIFGMAINDTMNRVAGINSGDKGNIEKSDKIKSTVKNYAESIINGQDSDFRETVNEIIKINNNDKDKIDCLNFGKIQKLINMTMKYLYIKYYDDSKISKRFEKCYAPMDSIMINFVFESYYIVNDIKRKRGENPGFKKDLTWSSLTNQVDDVDMFNKYQEAIDSIIEKKQLEINRIAFDMRYWDRAKKIINKNEGVKIQREEIEKLWDKE